MIDKIIKSLIEFFHSSTGYAFVLTFVISVLSNVSRKRSFLKSIFNTGVLIEAFLCAFLVIGLGSTIVKLLHLDEDSILAIGTLFGYIGTQTIKRVFFELLVKFVKIEFEGSKEYDYILENIKKQREEEDTPNKDKKNDDN